MSEFTIHRIEWENPISMKEAQNVSGPGLYQIYGNSPIYGKNVLLYIGKSEGIGERFGQHLNDIFAYQTNPTVRIGKYPPKSEYSPTMMGIAEAILICSLKPSFNSQEIQNITNMLRKESTFHLVQNCGDRGDLPLECSSYWWQGHLQAE